MTNSPIDSTQCAKPIILSSSFSESSIKRSQQFSSEKFLKNDKTLTNTLGKIRNITDGNSFRILSETTKLVEYAFDKALTEELEEFQTKPTLPSETLRKINPITIDNDKKLERLDQTSKEELLKVFKENTTEITPSPPTTSTAVNGTCSQKDLDENPILQIDFNNVFKKLDENADKLGGKIEPSRKKFFGISWETCQGHVRKKLNEKPKSFFWGICAKFFKVDPKGSPCQYTYVKATLNALQYVQTNFQDFQKDPSKAIEQFEKETGIPYHTRLNGTENFLPTVNIMANQLDELSKKTDWLNIFKNAFSNHNACWPTRANTLEVCYNAFMKDRIDFIAALNLTDKNLKTIVEEAKLNGVEIAENAEKEEIFEKCHQQIRKLKNENIFNCISGYLTKKGQNLTEKTNQETIILFKDVLSKQIELQPEQKDLTEVKIADIAKYLCEIDYGDIADYLTEGTQKQTIDEQECYVFEDGSKIPTDWEP